MICQWRADQLLAIVIHSRHFEASHPAWQIGTVVQATGPVSAQVKLEDGGVVRGDRDHVRRNEPPTMRMPETSAMVETSLNSDPVFPQRKSEESLTLGTPELKPSRTLWNRRLPEHFRDYEI